MMSNFNQLSLTKLHPHTESYFGSCEGEISQYIKKIGRSKNIGAGEDEKYIILYIKILFCTT